ncbi:hypothetical protein ACM66B_002285 [Microbotryomycetes sp. NB124-2]
MATEPGGSDYYDDWAAVDTSDIDHYQHDVQDATAPGVAGTDGRTVLVCVAAALSAGAILRVLAHKHQRTRDQQKPIKVKDKVVKKIKAQQQQQRLQQHSTNGGTTAANLADSHRPNTAASYAHDLFNRVSSLWSSSSNAAASTSAVKLDSSSTTTTTTSDDGGHATTLSPPSQTSSRRSSTTAEAFSTSVSRRQSVELPASRKGKARATGKHRPPPQTSSSSTAGSQATSPARGQPLKLASDGTSRHVSVVDAAVQVSFPLADEDGSSPSRSRSTVRQQRDVATETWTPPLLPPPPMPSPPRSKSERASTQTLPEREHKGNSSRRSSVASSFSIHATFQAAPELDQSPDAPQRSPSRSPVLAHAESRRGRSAQSSPTLHPASAAESSSRSRKQARKASANANSPGRVVVGLHRLVRDRDPTDESEAAMSGYNAAHSSNSALGSVDMSRSASASSAASNGSAPLLRSARLEAVASLGRRPMSVPLGKSYEPQSPMSHGAQRSPTPGGDSSSRSESSTSASPFFGANQQLLMTSSMMSGTTNGSQRRGSWNGERAVVDEEAFWRDRVTADFDPTNVRLAIELNERGQPTGDRASSSTGSRKDGSTGDSIGARAGSRSWSSADGSPPPSMPSLLDSYFPPPSQTALTTPDSSPHPTNRKLLSMSTASAHKQWQAMSPVYPIRSSTTSGMNSNGIGRQAPPPPANSGHGHAQMRTASTPSSRQPSRQPSLSLLIPAPPLPPPPPPPIPAGLSPVQQQAYAQMFAQAQSQYQHMIALQYQAQQIHQRQQQIALARQRLEMEQQHHSLARQPSSPGLVYPISSSTVQTPLSAPMSSPYWSNNGQQQPQQQMSHAGYPSQFSYGSLSQTASPTVASFQQNAQHLSNGSSHAYYLSSNGHLGSGFPPASPSRQPPAMSQRSASSSFTPVGNVKRSDVSMSASPLSAKRPQRPPHLRTRSASATATLSTTSLAPLAPLNLPSPVGSGGSRNKGKATESENDRAAKELEIARWRVSVLEEEQRLNDLENQEALRVLAARAMRAEARIKMLEGNVAGAPAAGGSTSEVYYVGMTTAAMDEWQPDSPSSAKIHPLSWLDLDSVSFSTRPQTSPVKSPPFLNSNHRRRSGRGSRRSRRKSTQGSATTTTQHAPPAMTPLDGEDEDEEEEVLIVLDAPRDRRASGASSVDELSSRSPSFVATQDYYSPSDQPSPMQERNDSSFASEQDDLDEDSDEGPSYIGSLPTFLQPPAGRTSRSSSLSGSSPRYGSAPDSDSSSPEDSYLVDEASVSVRRGMPDLSLDMALPTSLHHGHSYVNGYEAGPVPAAAVPKFQVDCATPDSAVGGAKVSTPLETIMASPPSSDTSPTGSIESSSTTANNTPKPPAASSPTDSDDSLREGQSAA